MSRCGTLVLYDMENLKTPIKQSKGRYIISRVDMIDIKESLRRVLNDTHFNDIAFVKTYHEKDKRWYKNNKFFNFLKTKGFYVVEKITKKANNIITTGGDKFVYSYEECDMDANIIHHILTLGREYSRVVLLSGDDDMLESLKYLQTELGTEIVVIAHKENMSKKLKEFRSIYLHELLDRGQSKKEEEY